MLSQAFAASHGADDNMSGMRRHEVISYFRGWAGFLGATKAAAVEGAAAAALPAFAGGRLGGSSGADAWLSAEAAAASAALCGNSNKGWPPSDTSGSLGGLDMCSATAATAA